MSHRTQGEYYDDDLLDDADLFDDAPPDDPPEDEYPEDHKEYELNDDDRDEEVAFDNDHIFRCKARYRGHIPCMQIFSCEYDISEHLWVTHKTRKWLVETFIRIT